MSKPDAIHLNLLQIAPKDREVLLAVSHDDSHRAAKPSRDYRISGPVIAYLSRDISPSEDHLRTQSTFALLMRRGRVGQDNLRMANRSLPVAESSDDRRASNRLPIT
jgi:hypothetical protein